MWRVALLLMLMPLAGCQTARRPDFLMRVLEDCAAGQVWACEMIEALSRPPPEEATPVVRTGR